ncbi:hypothetical protein Nepgr_032684 [Nepenthes gracilis]|uniref:Uncharacterized protein n=1 Tax=Nepenthes gracilis TaxID=150966 RepID=A0AAD3Y8H4_NEPGR|nr:hypothetical protein Nepgr_032684 [Nepenthes gracilis]
MAAHSLDEEPTLGLLASVTEEVSHEDWRWRPLSRLTGSVEFKVARAIEATSFAEELDLRPSMLEVREGKGERDVVAPEPRLSQSYGSS